MKNFKTKFFSILGASLLTAGLYSCSDEEANHLHQEDVKTENSVVVSKPLPPVEDEIDEMFFEYINSEEFYIAEIVTTNFFQKLNYTGDYQDIKTGQAFILWLESNITITDFVNINEAKEELNNLINLEKIKEDKFELLFDYIKTAPIDQVVSRFNKWFPVDISISTSNKCNDAFKECADRVSTQFQMEIRENYASTNCSEEEIKISNLAAKQAYQDGMNRCQDNWAVCINPKR